MPWWATGVWPCSRPPVKAVSLAAPPQPAYPRISAQRLDGVPWKYPFVPLKIGVFQELREAVLSGTPLPGAWLVHCPSEPGPVPAGSGPDAAGLRQDGFITTVDIIMNDTSWFSDVVLPEASYLERYDPLHIVGERETFFASRSLSRRARRSRHWDL